jgi:hypothetical protein
VLEVLLLEGTDDGEFDLDASVDVVLTDTGTVHEIEEILAAVNGSVTTKLLDEGTYENFQVGDMIDLTGISGLEVYVSLETNLGEAGRDGTKVTLTFEGGTSKVISLIGVEVSNDNNVITVIPPGS